MLRLQNNDTLHFLGLQNIEKLKVIRVPHSSINQFIKWMAKQALVFYLSLCCNWSYTLLCLSTHPGKYSVLLSSRKKPQWMSKMKRSSPWFSWSWWSLTFKNNPKSEPTFICTETNEVNSITQMTHKDR